MKNMLWVMAVLAAGVGAPVITAQEDGPPSRPPEAARFNTGVKEKRYPAAIADLRARVDALEKIIANRNPNAPDLPPNEPLPPRRFNRPAPGPGEQPERGRFYAPPAPGPGRGDAMNPLRNLGLPPEQMDMLRKRVAETRERQMVLREKLAAARQALQEAACEQRINEEAIQDQANRMAKIEAEMALTQGKLIRELREKLPPEKFEQFELYLKRGLGGMPDWRPPVGPDEPRRPQPRLYRRSFGPPRGDSGYRYRGNPEGSYPPPPPPNAN